MAHSSQRILSPLARARGAGSAHHGAGHWMRQRITAIANIPLMLWLVWSVVHMQGWGYADVTAWLAQPVNAVLMILAVLSTFYHAALGAQVVVEDYVPHPGFRMGKIIGLRLFFIAAAVASVFSILKVAFAG
ncbi:MAG: succinate dehydrogenase, hydrophobic membrane anchor protein [Micavibrio aeruginosavorus]|uniref:Succinate dehydrogenase hydrophobic membrane anchor subunit n=1 Tax=Micavibrio aeruginosavorus TaxID=349221 RepID=A0A7T5R285_9BACT|nr:MAG: succinate dehydrogenase, hydrophobic membrane anchor protein [Micavibrio aeruginosavorus]